MKCMGILLLCTGEVFDNTMRILLLYTGEMYEDSIAIAAAVILQLFHI